MSLIDDLIKGGWLKSQRIIDAFKKIKRVDFLPEDLKGSAELNMALPIGFGQTISQPLVVAFMIEQLNPQKGDKVLDVGSGSGWTTALLAHIVSQGRNSKSEFRNSKQITNSKLQNSKGKVVAIERISELKEFGQENVSKYNFIKKGIVEFFCGDGSKGYEKEAPFDAILASASAQKLPGAWKEQLKVDGRIVTPIGSSIWVFIKKGEDNFEEFEHPGFAFVPLIGA